MKTLEQLTHERETIFLNRDILAEENPKPLKNDSDSTNDSST